MGHDTTTYTVKDLVPFTRYEFVISAGTAAGYGPSVLLTATTSESSKFQAHKSNINRLFIVLLMK